MKDSPSSGDGLAATLGRLASRQAAGERGGRRRSRFVTGRASRERARLVSARKALTIAAGLLALYSAIDLLHPLGALALLSALPVLAGTCLQMLPLLEIALGAGCYWVMAYRTSGRQLRKSRFEPSIRRLSGLLLPLSLSLIAQIAGFASLHRLLSQAFAGSYSETLSPLVAVYYSVTTFTRGIVDIDPIGDGARALTALQSLLGWLAVVAIVSTLLAWIQQRQRSRRSRRGKTNALQSQ